MQISYIHKFLKSPIIVSVMAGVHTGFQLCDKDSSWVMEKTTVNGPWNFRETPWNFREQPFHTVNYH